MDQKKLLYIKNILEEETLASVFKKGFKEFFLKIYPDKYGFIYLTKIRHIYYSRFYKKHPNPYKLVWVSPDNISLYTKEISQRYGLGQIKCGDWDKKAADIENNFIYKGLRERFCQQNSWENTTYYNEVLEIYESGRTIWGYQSIEDFKKNRLGYVDNLYNNIKNNGYRTNIDREHNVPNRDVRSSQWYQSLEPLIAIGRDGTLIHVDGFHRLAILDILDIDQIPVQICARHTNWLNKREELKSLNMKGHPDDPNLDSMSRNQMTTDMEDR